MATGFSFSSKFWLCSGLICSLLQLTPGSFADEFPGHDAAGQKQFEQTPLRLALNQYSDGLALLEKSGDREAAMKKFRAALDLDPSFWPAKEELGEVRFLEREAFQFSGTEDELRTKPGVLYQSGRLDKVIKSCQEKILNGTGPPMTLRKRLVKLYAEKVRHDPNADNYLQLASAKECVHDIRGAKHFAHLAGCLRPEQHGLRLNARPPDLPRDKHTKYVKLLQAWQQYEPYERARNLAVRGNYDEAIRQYLKLDPLMSDADRAEIQGCKIPDWQDDFGLRTVCGGCDALDFDMPEPWFEIRSQEIENEQLYRELARIGAEKGRFKAAIDLIEYFVASPCLYSSIKTKAQELEERRKTEDLLRELVLQLQTSRMKTEDIGIKIQTLVDRGGVIPRTYCEFACLDLLEGCAEFDSLKPALYVLFAEEVDQKGVCFSQTLSRERAWRWLVLGGLTRNFKTNWYWEKAINFAEKVSGDEHLAPSLVALACADPYDDDVFPQSKQLFERALRVFAVEKNPRNELLADALFDYGLYCLYDKDLDAAIDLFKRACSMYEVRGKKNYIAQCHFAIARASLQSSKWQQAKIELKSAYDAAEAAGDQKLSLRSLRLLAKLANQQLDSEAENLDERVLKIDHTLKKRDDIFSDLLRIARRKELECDWKALGNYLQEARPIYEILSASRAGDSFGSEYDPSAVEAIPPIESLNDKELQRIIAPHLYPNHFFRNLPIESSVSICEFERLSRILRSRGSENTY